MSSAITVDIALTPSQMQGNEFISDLRGNKSWSDVEETVRQTSSLIRISNEKNKQKKVLQPCDGFDTIEELKAYTDTKDKLLIYDINNNDQYVFKTSTKMMQIAHDMNVCCDHFLSEEYCFFDGNHKRVRGFVTLTASMYHPLLQRQTILATTQCKHENKKFVEIFWRVYNRAYKDINGEGKQFNPIGWCADMASSALFMGTKC